jgi:hypothetical protein
LKDTCEIAMLSMKNVLRQNQHQQTLGGGTKFVISASIGVIYIYIIGGNTFRYAKAFQKCIFQTQAVVLITLYFVTTQPIQLRLLITKNRLFLSNFLHIIIFSIESYVADFTMSLKKYNINV